MCKFCELLDNVYTKYVCDCSTVHKSETSYGYVRCLPACPSVLGKVTNVLTQANLLKYIRIYVYISLKLCISSRYANIIRRIKPPVRATPILRHLPHLL